MKCRNCGKEIEKDAKTCKHCNANLEKAKKNIIDLKDKKTLIIGVIVIVIIIAIIVNTSNKSFTCTRKVEYTNLNEKIKVNIANDEVKDIDFELQFQPDNGISKDEAIAELKTELNDLEMGVRNIKAQKTNKGIKATFTADVKLLEEFSDGDFEDNIYNVNAFKKELKENGYKCS